VHAKDCRATVGIFDLIGGNWSSWLIEFWETHPHNTLCDGLQVPFILCYNFQNSKWQSAASLFLNLCLATHIKNMRSLPPKHLISITISILESVLAEWVTITCCVSCQWVAMVWLLRYHQSS